MHELAVHITEDDDTRVTRLEFPSKFEEFTRRHLEALSGWLVSAKDDTAFPRFIVSFLGLKKKTWNQLSADQLFYCELSDEGEIDFMPELSYLNESYENLNSLVKRVGIFVGPDDRLKNISLERIAFADMFSQAYADDPKDTHLNLFFASIYRPFFLPFHKRLLNAFAFAARAVPRRTKIAGLINYRGMMLASRQLYPTAFKSEGGQPSKIARLGWAGTIRKLARTGMHGTEAQCRRMKYTDAMLTFEFNNLDAEEQEARIKKATQK